MDNFSLDVFVGFFGPQFWVVSSIDELVLRWCIADEEHTSRRLQVSAVQYLLESLWRERFVEFSGFGEVLNLVCGFKV